MGVPEGYVTIYGYPKICTNAEWQKKKSFKDKLKKATKTGLGAELLKAEAAYKKIKWEIIDAKMQGKWADGDAIAAGKVRAQQHYTNVIKPATAIFLRASKVAHTTSKNAALSATAQAAATAISKELLRHVGVWNTIDYDDFDEVLQRWQQGVALWRSRLKGNVKKLEDLLDALEDDPKLANWDNELTQAFRSVGNSLGNNPEFRDIWPTWQPWDGLHHTKHPKLKGKSKPEEEAEAIRSIIATTRPHLNALKRRVA